jgi:catechol 2,3-dioxygenase-like lactoylglutathione lyase family enzyme
MQSMRRASAGLTPFPAALVTRGASVTAREQASAAQMAALDHVGISVADLPKATEWWCRALGLAVEHRVQKPGTDLTGVMLLHPSGFRVELLHRPHSVPNPRPASPTDAAATQGYGHLCLRVEDVPRAYDDLVREGATPLRGAAPSPNRPRAVNAFVADPDGNLIEVTDRPT